MSDDMTTPTKPWPRYAEWARMDAVASAIRAANSIELAMVHITDAETLRHLHSASKDCFSIQLSLNQIKSEMERED